MAILTLSHSTFAIDATSETSASLSAEIIFSTAITSVTSEISSFSSLEAQKASARKVLREIQEYNQTGSMTAFVAEKIAVIHTLDNTLSVDESVDVLIEASEFILAK